MVGGLIVAALVVYLLACALAGFGTVGDDLRTFEPSIGPIVKQFDDSPTAVQHAYVRAVSVSPGMRMVTQDEHAILVDLRPTSRILGGNFGMALRVRLGGGPGAGTSVVVDAHKKVPFAFAVNSDAALAHAERALRMNAKKQGVTETL